MIYVCPNGHEVAELVGVQCHCEARTVYAPVAQVLALAEALADATQALQDIADAEVNARQIARDALDRLG